MKRLLAILISCLAFLTGSADVLLWQVDENTTVDGGNIQQFLVPYPSTDDSWPAARVKLVSSDGSSSTILKVIGMEEQPEYWGIEPWDTGSGYWETGICQSQTGYNTITSIQDQLNGIISSYPPEIMDALFIMELGYNEWNDDAGDYVWRTLAESAPELYRELVGRHMYASGDVAPSTMVPWSPDFRSVPEPNSFVLLTLGICLLGLRRKSP